jgi:predicted RNA binding protein YcfA (HicA-like mRNA interferase family)
VLPCSSGGCNGVKQSNLKTPPNISSEWTAHSIRFLVIRRVVSCGPPLKLGVACAEAFGFQLSRINGSHHIYIHANIPELLNIQNVNGQAKPYQVKQLLRLIERYNLEMGDES